MIKRTVYDTTPVTVEYKAIEYSLTIKPAIEMMTEWGRNTERKYQKKLHE